MGVFQFAALMLTGKRRLFDAYIARCNKKCPIVARKQGFSHPDDDEREEVQGGGW